MLVSAVAASSARAQISDDFSGPALDQNLWTFVDPVGDCSFMQANGQLVISVPAGTPHDLWTPANQSARVLQAAADTDLSLEVKFESTPSLAYQAQGLLLEAAPGDYVRLDFLRVPTGLRLFCATFVNHQPTVRGDIAVASGSALWLRATRTGSSFGISWSSDGIAWQPAFTFNHAMTLSAVGVYAANDGSPVPAFDAVVDYFFDTEAPIDPEDGDIADIWAPVVTGIVVASDFGAGTALVSCTTSEPATAFLSYGLDDSYGADVAGATVDGFQHAFALSGLVPETVYHFSITAADTLANTAATSDRQFQLVDTRPVITVWGGLDHRVGHLGTAQADFNLMGNVFRWEDLATLTYSLNGGAARLLNWGNGANDFGDYRRLARNGDFNVDLPISQLLPGVNTIAVHAVDINGGSDQVTATVTLESGSSLLPLLVDWETATDPQEAGQSVDGDWVLDAQGLRTVSVGYDRIFLLGETTWQDYEILCPVTIHQIQSVTGPLSEAPGLGFMMRFAGHVVGGFRNWPDAQPKWGYQPFGALGWLRWTAGPAGSPAIQFYRGDSDATQNFGTAPGAVAGSTWWLRMRCETLPDAPGGEGVTRYSLRVWPDQSAEPPVWNYEVEQLSAHALRQGSVGLLAHHVDVTFGDVVVSNLDTTADAGDVTLPTRFSLAGSYPNPFNPQTTIAFELPGPGRTTLMVYNTRGSLVATLLDAELAAGRHEAIWNGTDAGGRAVPSGTYLYRLESGGRTAVGKLLMLK